MHRNILRFIFALGLGVVLHIVPVKTLAVGGTCTQEPCICDGTCGDLGGTTCTGPNACNATECCVQGSCEPKSGGGCDGGTISCPPGTTLTGSYPSCTIAGNPPCCTATPLPSACPSTCSGCATAACGQCSTTASGWRCQCSGSCNGQYTSCGGVLDATCNTGASPTPRSSPTPTPAPTYILAGVYNDSDNNCVLGSPYFDGNGGGLIYPYGWTTSDPAYNSVVRIGLDQAPSGSYTGSGGVLRQMGASIRIRAPEDGRSRTLYLANLPAGYRCSDGPGCPSCPVRSGAYAEWGDTKFFITNQPTPTPSPVANGAWWQAEGAGVYAGSQLGGTTVRSDLPSSTSFILPGIGGTSGVLVRGSGTPSLGSGSLSSEGWSALASYRGKRMDYNYFSANMGVLKNSTGEWTLNNEIDLSTYPSASDFAYRNGDGYVVDPITVASGESYVVFVNGNLSIESNITVANGGFLAFIVNGVTTVSPSVQTLQGIYVTDDDFVTERFDPTGTFDDVALDVEGTVVTWGNFELGRELGILNSTTPAEKFSYRSDFLTNMPDKMKSFAMEWQEVAAGSFE